MRGGRGAGHGDSPSGKDRTAGWGTPRQGSLPGELRVLARHLQIGCRGTGTRGNHPRIRRRHLTQQENDRVAHSNTNKQTNVDTVHAGQAAPAPQYRAPSPVDDPPDPSSTSEGSDDEDGSPSMPFWDWGPSRRHAKSIRLLSNEDLRSLGAGETLVAQVQQVMKHIERVSKPILEAITADSAPVWPPLQRHTEQWAHLQQGTQQKIWFKNSNSMCLRKQTILKQKRSENCSKKAQIKQISV